MRNITSVKSGLSLYLAIFFLFAGYSVCFGQRAELEDVVYLKNGSIVRGTIIEQIPGKKLKIETSDGDVLKFKMDEVERVVKDSQRLLIPVPNADDLYHDNRDEDTSIDWLSLDPNNGNRRKSPGMAFLASFLFPGGGQFYNGEHSKGFTVLGFAASGIAIVLSVTSTSDTGEEMGIGAKLGAAFGVALFSGSIIWSMGDAPVSAYRINRENGLASGYRISENLFVDMKLKEIATKKTPTLQATFSF